MAKPIRILNSFDLLTDSKLLERANSIQQNIAVSTSIFPLPVPSMVTLLTGIEEFQSAVNNAAAGDKNKMGVRDAEKEKLVNLLHLVGYYVLFTAAGDRLVVQLSGFTLAKPSTPQSEMPKPGEVQLTLGDQSGVMHSSVKTVRGAVAYMHQYTTDVTLLEANWVSYTCSTSKCTFTGLVPGTMYYVRLGAIGRKNQLKFSDVTSRIAA